MIFFIFRKRYSIGEVLKRIFLQNPGITKALANERDVKPRNMNFAKLVRREGGGGGGGVTGQGVVQINTVSTFFKGIISMNWPRIELWTFCIEVKCPHHNITTRK